MEWFKELRALRTRLGLSQEDLARRLNVRARTYARWEKGEPQKPKLVELEQVRGMVQQLSKPRRKRS